MIGRGERGGGKGRDTKRNRERERQRAKKQRNEAQTKKYLFCILFLKKWWVCLPKRVDSFVRGGRSAEWESQDRGRMSPWSLLWRTGAHSRGALAKRLTSKRKRTPYPVRMEGMRKGLIGRQITVCMQVEQEVEVTQPRTAWIGLAQGQSGRDAACRQNPGWDDDSFRNGPKEATTASQGGSSS